MVKRALLAVFLAAAGISLAYAETLVPTEDLSVPAGTMLHCRTTQTLTTKLNFQGDAFTMSLAEPVSVDGRVAIPVGSTLAGHIARMERPGRIKGVGQMRLTVEQITLPDGRNFPLGATLMTAYGVDNVKVVGSEGLIKGPSSRVPDFEEIGAGTAGGTLLGLIFAHPVIGATVGLTATTVDRMRRRGKDLTIPVGTQLNYQLTRELAITRNAPRATAANQVHPAGE
jgi:type IV secretion system protein VirB10